MGVGGREDCGETHKAHRTFENTWTCCKERPVGTLQEWEPSFALHGRQKTGGNKWQPAHGGAVHKREHGSFRLKGSSRAQERERNGGGIKKKQWNGMKMFLKVWFSCQHGRSWHWECTVWYWKQPKFTECGLLPSCYPSASPQLLPL